MPLRFNEAFIEARIQAITSQNIYTDHNFEDPRTGTRSKKHCLATKRIPNIDEYSFCLLFGSNIARRKICCVEIITEKHLVDRDPNHYIESIGYIDVSEVFTLTVEKIRNILLNDSSRLKKTSRLCDEKWQEVLALLQNAPYILAKYEKEKQIEIAKAFHYGEIAERILKSLGH